MVPVLVRTLNSRTTAASESQRQEFEKEFEPWLANVDSVSCTASIITRRQPECPTEQESNLPVVLGPEHDFSLLKGSNGNDRAIKGTTERLVRQFYRPVDAVAWV